MKQLILLISIFLLPSLIGGTRAHASVEFSQKKSNGSNEAQNLVDRLNELKLVDRSTMTVPERKELRKEIRYTAHQLKEPGSGGGILISLIPLVLAVVLIILFI